MSNLDFEKPLVELEKNLDELKHLSGNKHLNIAEEVEKLRSKTDKMLKSTYAKLSPAQKVQVARHPLRPHTIDYINGLFTDFEPLAGDRAFADDKALVGGLARFKDYPCVVMGQEKGKDTEERVRHNFGMAKPEGYRKAQRLMLLADKFKLPIISFVDTAGAYPGVEAEARGQAEAIAKSIEVGLKVNVPFITVVIGEGGSGGAIAIATADKVLMLEHSIYSVISPEGCASILWRSASFADVASEALKLTAQDLKELKIIDDIIPEPLGGAHRYPAETIKSVGDVILKNLEEILRTDAKSLAEKRAKKFLEMTVNL